MSAWSNTESTHITAHVHVWTLSPLPCSLPRSLSCCRSCMHVMSLQSKYFWMMPTWCYCDRFSIYAFVILTRFAFSMWFIYFPTSKLSIFLTLLKLCFLILDEDRKCLQLYKAIRWASSILNFFLTAHHNVAWCCISKLWANLRAVAVHSGTPWLSLASRHRLCSWKVALRNGKNHANPVTGYWCFFSTAARGMLNRFLLTLWNIMQSNSCNNTRQTSVL